MVEATFGFCAESLSESEESESESESESDDEVSDNG